MSLELSGTTGLKGVAGSVAAPSIVGDDTNTGISFPAADTIKFSTGGVERMSITNSGITGIPGGLFTSYALLADQKSNGSNGGTFTAGLQIRDLNTKISDADNIVTLSNNIMTLGAGTYLVQASAPAFKVNEHQIVLFRESGTQTTLAEGTNELSANSYSGHVRSFVRHRFTTSGSINLQIRHYGTTTKTTNGFGVVCNFTTEVYTIVEIFKLA